MRGYLFVARVFGLLIGFYLMSVALVACMITLTVLAFRAIGVNRATLLLLVVTLGVIYVVIRGVFVSMHVKERDIVGVEVTPAEQPVLWTRVRQLAEQVGTRAPRKLYLVPDVNAAVWENTRLLGLIPGSRRMVIGVPVLIALTPAQLDAVLAHELGHYGNRDTRVGALVGRTRQSVLGALRAAVPRQGRFRLPGGTLFLALFRWYAMVVLRVTQQASRAQEYAADRVAGRIAGPANAIAALGVLGGTDAAFSFYLARYISPGAAIGLLPPPPELFGGFMALLAEPARQAELDQLRREPPEEKADAFDSHPPITERIAALAALPGGDAPPQVTSVRAVSLLANPADVFTRVAMRMLQKAAVGKRVASWDALAREVGLNRADERAKPLQEVVARMSGRPADLPTFVELVGAGRLDAILDALPRNEASRRTRATGRVAREHAKTELASMLGGWVTGHAVRSGWATWTHSWADVRGDLQLAPQVKADVAAAVEDLVALRPDARRLRALVLGRAVPA